MRSNKCISPFILNGRSMADMKTMGMLAQCKKSREIIIKEDYEQVCTSTSYQGLRAMKFGLTTLITSQLLWSQGCDGD